MKKHYLKMLAYNYWANGLFLKCFSDNTVANARNYLLMSHLLTVEEIWLCRLKGEEAPNERLWQEYDLPTLKEKAAQNRQTWQAWLQARQEADFSEIVSYRNSQGKACTTSVADILNHVISHGSYHRAQIAALLSLEAVDPPKSDYIVYTRQLH